MIATFERPESPGIKNLWLQVASVNGQRGSGEGIESLSGWITAFCYWTKDGVPLRDLNDPKFAAILPPEQRLSLAIDGVVFPHILTGSVPKSLVSVPVTIKEVGRMPYEVSLVAGLVGMKGVKVDGAEDCDRVQPLSGWWMLEEPESEAETAAVEKGRNGHSFGSRK